MILNIASLLNILGQTLKVRLGGYMLILSQFNKFDYIYSLVKRVIL